VTAVPFRGRDGTRTAVVVFHGDGRMSDRGARAMAEMLAAAGVAIAYLDGASPRRVARVAAEERADSVEVCLAGTGVRFLLDLLRELNSVAGRGVKIVVHRVR
jgi:methylmalonyl-CoA mutase cobalamin-binding subunit